MGTDQLKTELEKALLAKAVEFTALGQIRLTSDCIEVYERFVAIFTRKEDQVSTVDTPPDEGKCSEVCTFDHEKALDWLFDELQKIDKTLSQHEIDWLNEDEVAKAGQIKQSRIWPVDTDTFARRVRNETLRARKRGSDNAYYRYSVLAQKYDIDDPWGGVET